MQGVFRHPIDVRNTDLNNRVVYSPRIYGPDVYDMEVRQAHLNTSVKTGVNSAGCQITCHPVGYDIQQYFSDPAFPERLTEVWDSQFAWLERTTGRAAVMGEWGGSLEEKDREIQEHLSKWMASRCIDDSFWWVFTCIGICMLITPYITRGDELGHSTGGCSTRAP